LESLPQQSKKHYSVKRKSYSKRQCQIKTTALIWRLSLQIQRRKRKSSQIKNTRRRNFKSMMKRMKRISKTLTLSLVQWRNSFRTLLIMRVMTMTMSIMRMGGSREWLSYSRRSRKIWEKTKVKASNSSMT
jgi:hypothetical protein